MYDTSQELTLFHDFIQRIHPLKPAAWTDLAAACRPVAAKRKEILTEEHSTERYLYFVLEGVQRVYAIGDDGRASTLVFTYAPSFGGVADSFLLQQPAQYRYETLTPSQFLRISFGQLDRLMVMYRL